MKEPTKNYIPSDTTKMFDEFSRILYLLGLRNVWVEDVKLPKTFVKVFDALYPLMYGAQWIFCLLQFGAIFHQEHFTPIQKSDLLVYSLGEPLVHLLCLHFVYNKKKCRQVFYYIAVVLKEVYNDKVTEQSLIKKLKLFLVVFSIIAHLHWLHQGLQALYNVVRSGTTFIAVITVWPEVTDTSTLASCVRIIFYILHLFSFYRSSIGYFIVLVVFISLSHQYKNLCRYFERLNSIFEDTQLSHEEMEMKFEEALKKGIQIHYDTLWCAREAQTICNGISSLIVLLAITMLPSMLNCNGFEDLSKQMTKILISTVIMGLFMWNAGDVTVEARKLPDTIFGCGWYNCYGKRSRRIRSLVVIAIMQAQKPVVFTAFTVVELSHETFLTIIKTAYSMVSVLYQS